MPWPCLLFGIQCNNTRRPSRALAQEKEGPLGAVPLGLPQLLQLCPVKNKSAHERNGPDGRLPASNLPCQMICSALGKSAGQPRGGRLGCPGESLATLAADLHQRSTSCTCCHFPKSSRFESFLVMSPSELSRFLFLSKCTRAHQSFFHSNEQQWKFPKPKSISQKVSKRASYFTYQS